MKICFGAILLAAIACVAWAGDPTLAEQESFTVGERLMQAGRWKQAERAFKDHLEAYHAPSSLRAAAWYEIARCRWERGKRPKAMEAYGLCIKEDQDSEWAKKAMREPMDFCMREMTRIQSGAHKGPFNAHRREQMVELSEKALAVAPFEPNADTLQLFVADSHLKQKDWPEAEQAYQQLLKSYPDSEWRDDSFLHLCEVEFLQCRTAEHDLSRTEVALSRLNDFLAIYGQSPLAGRAQSMKGDLLERRARKAFATAEFYERRKKPQAALLCYERVHTEFKGTVWDERASKKIEDLARKEKEKGDAK